MPCRTGTPDQRWRPPPANRAGRVVDLRGSTGQLSRPLARPVLAVVRPDPEPYTKTRQPQAAAQRYPRAACMRMRILA